MIMMTMMKNLSWLVLIPVYTTAFTSTTTYRLSTAVFADSSVDYARNLLYQDQQEAMGRRAAVEEELLRDSIQMLEAPPRVAKGFGDSSSKIKSSDSNSSKKSENKQAVQQAKIMQDVGVLRINKALKAKTADKLRAHVLQEQALAENATANDASMSKSYFGVENERKSRCDLQLSLLQADNGKHPVADALQELLGRDGTLREVYEELVTQDGEFYELAAIITNTGSDRQTVHADLPFRRVAPLYVVFLALQDVDQAMGPTAFLPRTHTESANRLFLSDRDQQLLNSQCQLACLKKGDAVVFDARLLHCGTANVSENTRAMFNFSFRNPKEAGNLGYPGSLRPGYVASITLQSMGEALEAFRKDRKQDPFSAYGDGLQEQ